MLRLVLALLIFIISFAVLIYALSKMPWESRISGALTKDLEECRDLSKRRKND